MGYSIWEITKAFIDDHFELAVNLYTGHRHDPSNSELYSDCAQANIKSNNLTGNKPPPNSAKGFDRTISNTFTSSSSRSARRPTISIDSRPRESSSIPEVS